MTHFTPTKNAIKNSNANKVRLIHTNHCSFVLVSYPLLDVLFTIKCPVHYKCPMKCLVYKLFYFEFAKKFIIKTFFLDKIFLLH